MVPPRRGAAAEESSADRICLGNCRPVQSGAAGRGIPAEGCGNSAMLRAKTSWSSIDTLRERVERLPGLVAELVQLKVDVLVIIPQRANPAAKQATKTIPIVMVTTVDPVAAGLVDSFARPGGNITGITTLTRELAANGWSCLRRWSPKISRVALLWNADSLTAAGTEMKEYEAAARDLKDALQSMEVRGANPDFEARFRRRPRRVSALIAIQGAVLIRYPKQIADLAIKNRLPSIYRRKRLCGGGG